MHSFLRLKASPTAWKGIKFLDNDYYDGASSGDDDDDL